jgi:hypothetical protein
MQRQENLKQLATSYPIQLDLRYKVLNPNSTVAGTGKTLEISSTGIVFIADGPIEPGTKVELSMAWPALLDNCVALQFVSEVKITVREGQTLRANIWKYHFRTRGTGASLQKTVANVVEMPGPHRSRFEQLVLRAHA